ncbi:MAG TPA: hypothetical protein VKT75_14695, partial [Acidobacteriaceae bacterium]|nr:hypothetical protein [Acidobacteriaceae bacterium]
CVDKGCELGDLTLYELRQFGEEFEDDFFDAITLQATLDCHDVIGGTARARVRQAVEATESRIRALAERYGVPHSPDADQEAAHAGA